MTTKADSETKGSMPLRWLSSLIIGASIIASAVVFSGALKQYIRVRFEEQHLTVTGSSTKRIQSDLVIWSAVVHARADDLASAYAELQKGTPRVRQFLLAQKIPESEVAVGSVTTDEIYAHNEEGFELREKIIGYDLVQRVQVTSKNINLIKQVSQDITQLIESGIDVRSVQPEYLYTGLGELKIELIAAATRDARDRAKQVVENTGGRLGRLRGARVGVIQVNAANESDVTWDGINDRSSIDKDAMAVVHTTFVLE